MDVLKSRIFEIQVFVFDNRWKSNVGLIKLEEKICDVQDIHVFDLAFPHTKFGSVRMKGSQVKRGGGGGGGRIPPLI